MDNIANTILSLKSYYIRVLPVILFSILVSFNYKPNARVNSVY